MMYRVYWQVNDGRFGYPNMPSDLDCHDVSCRTYDEAIRAYAERKLVRKILSISETIGPGSKGKINGRNYRDYLVDYLAKNVTEEKEFYVGGEVVSKTVRVFGNRSGKKANSIKELMP